MSKTSRMIQLMHIIYQKQSFTVGEMAEELGVSYRTMLRYLDELSATGVPLYSETGKHGGYRVLQTIPSRYHPLSATTHIGSVIVKPSCLIVGVPYRAPFSALLFSQTVIRGIKRRIHHERHHIPHGLKHGPLVGLTRREGSDFLYLAGVEVASLNRVPSGMMGKMVPAGSYMAYTHQGTWDRLQVEETLAYAEKQLASNGLEPEPAADIMEVHHLDRPDRIDIYVPIKEPSKK